LVYAHTGPNPQTVPTKAFSFLVYGLSQVFARIGLRSSFEKAIMQIAIFGAPGPIGKSIADALQARGMAYRAVGRDRARLESAFGADPLAELMAWDPDDAGSVLAAATGIETLIFCVGVPYDQNALYPIIMQQTLDGAIAAGVKRIVLIGTVYPYGKPEATPVTEAHPRNPTTFKGRMRKEQEDILLRAHAAGKIEATVLRLPDFYGPEVGVSSFLHLVFAAAASGGTADMIGPIDTPHEFVFVPDVGPVVVDLVAKPEAYGHWWNLAGTGVTTQREMADAIFAQAKRKPKLRAIGKTGLRIFGLFSPVMRELVEMHYLQTTPLLMNDSALTALIGPIKKTSYAEGIALTSAAPRYARKP
jgi:nucleoside-diphosphate-sugar epimerase